MNGKQAESFKRISSAANIAPGACPRASSACLTYRFCHRGFPKGVPLGKRGSRPATFCHPCRGVLELANGKQAESLSAHIIGSKHRARRLSPRLARLLNLSVLMQRLPP